MKGKSGNLATYFSRILNWYEQVLFYRHSWFWRRKWSIVLIVFVTRKPSRSFLFVQHEYHVQANGEGSWGVGEDTQFFFQIRVCGPDFRSVGLANFLWNVDNIWDSAQNMLDFGLRGCSLSRMAVLPVLYQFKVYNFDQTLILCSYVSNIFTRDQGSKTCKMYHIFQERKTDDLRRETGGLIHST